jgi:hypothetical protein
MDKNEKTGEEVKKEALMIINGYVKGFKDVQPGVPYFEGYRAALDTVKSNIEEIKVSTEDPKK